MIVDAAAKTNDKARLAFDIIQPFVIARKHLNSLISTMLDKGAEALLSMVCQSGPKLHLLDETSKIELAVIYQLSGEQATRRGYQQLMACMPSASSPVPPETTAQRLDALRTCAGHRLAPPTIQETLRHVSSLVEAIMDGRAPDMRSALGNASLRPIVTSFQYFVRYGSGAKAKYGTEALQDIFKECSAKHKTNSASLSDVAPLCVYSWLLPADLVKEARELISAIKLQASCAMKTLASKKSCSKSGLGEKDSAVKMAMDMFR